jgi:phosphoribosylglycinamide formyltransferase-1
MSLPLGVLLSGGGSNLQALIDRIEQGALQASIRLVVSDNPEAFGLKRAERHGIPARVLEPRGYASRQAHDGAVITALQEAGVRAVALAGYMRLVSRRFVDAFPGMVLNIHPALLPSFKGLEAQKQAAGYGVRISGATVHFVDEHLDHGPIIVQAALPVPPGTGGEALKERILALEHRIYPQAVQWLAEDRLRVAGGAVSLLAGEKGRAEIAGLEPCLIEPFLEEGF